MGHPSTRFMASDFAVGEDCFLGFSELFLLSLQPAIEMKISTTYFNVFRIQQASFNWLY